MKKQKTTEAKARGAPSKKEEEKILPNGLRPDQWKYLQEEAEIREVKAAQLLRQGIDWFIEALETGKKIPIVNAELETAEEEARAKKIIH